MWVLRTEIWRSQQQQVSFTLKPSLQPFIVFVTNSTQISLIYKQCIVAGDVAQWQSAQHSTHWAGRHTPVISALRVEGSRRVRSSRFSLPTQPLFSVAIFKLPVGMSEEVSLGPSSYFTVTEVTVLIAWQLYLSLLTHDYPLTWPVCFFVQHEGSNPGLKNARQTLSHCSFFFSLQILPKMALNF